MLLPFPESLCWGVKMEGENEKMREEEGWRMLGDEEKTDEDNWQMLKI